ncbi:MAG: hypothetical protein NW215_13125 [Hyphomicrobiales bacterium]|nr:hypothetical protein [Hyphomicrobiales bacterium]
MPEFFRIGDQTFRKDIVFFVEQFNAAAMQPRPRQNYSIKVGLTTATPENYRETCLVVGVDYAHFLDVHSDMFIPIPLDGIALNRFAIKRVAPYFRARLAPPDKLRYLSWVIPFEGLSKKMLTPAKDISALLLGEVQATKQPSDKTVRPKGP